MPKSSTYGLNNTGTLRWRLFRVIAQEYPNEFYSLADIDFSQISRSDIIIGDIGQICDSVIEQGVDLPGEQRTRYLGAYSWVFAHVQQWAKSIGLSNEEWAYCYAVELLTELKRNLTQQIGTKTIIDTYIETRAMIIAMFNYEGEPPNFVVEPWDMGTQKKQDYKKLVRSRLRTYFDKVECYNKRFGNDQLDNWPMIDEHLKWLSWVLVEDSTLDEVFERSGKARSTFGNGVQEAKRRLVLSER